MVDLAGSVPLSRMSHELRTPLHAILGFAQLLEVDSLRPDQRESVQQILQAGHHLLEMVDTLMDLSCLQAGRLELSIQPVSAREVLTKTRGQIAPLAARREVQLCPLVAGDDNAYLLADRRRLEQILVSLLSNGVNYNHPGGKVTTSWERATPDRLRLKVCDTGPGIPEELRSHLFTPFERLGAERTGIEGTGLGLALARRLAEAMQGTLTVESIEGEGSCFSVELPIVDDPCPGDEPGRRVPRACFGGRVDSGRGGS